MRTILATLVVALGLAAGAAPADAKQVRYVGIHPLPDKVGGTCYIEAPHVHVFAPHKPEVMYRVHDGDYYFVGDPVPYEYDGPRHAYYGHHSIHVDVLVDGAPADEEPEFCYLDGPHYHSWSPPAGVTFEVKGGASWYVGPFPARYKQHKKRYVAINAVYRPLRYERPTVVVEPPVGYVGPVVDVHAPVVEVGVPAVEVVAPAVEVHGPAVRAGVEVHVPVPTIEVGIGLPGVIVDAHHVHSHSCGHHGHYRKFKGKHKGKHKGRGGRLHIRDHRR